MSELTRFELNDLPFRANEVLQEITSNLVGWGRENNYLFKSNSYDNSHSLTVSAMSMLALHEVGHPIGDHTHDAILSHKQKDPITRGAFPAQVGKYCHTYGTAWILFACLHIRPSGVTSFYDTVDWLIAQRTDSNKGWGHTRDSHPRAFFTAYVLNSLLEYLECLSALDAAPQGLPKKIVKAVEDGIDFLMEDRRATDVMLWSFDRKDQSVCIASTAIALHVLAKYFKGEFGCYHAHAENFREMVGSTFEALGTSLGPNSLTTGETVIKAGKQNFRVNLWPLLKEDAPSGYANAYFTPLIGVTFLEMCKMLYPNGIAALRSEILVFVEWIINNVSRDENGKSEGVLGPGNRVYVWSTAKSIIVLSRWLNSLKDYVFTSDFVSGPVTPNPCAQLEPNSTNT